MATPPAPSRQHPLPLFPLNALLVPGMQLSLHVFEPRYRKLVRDLFEPGGVESPEFGVVALRHGWEVGSVADVYEVGTTARITDVVPHPDGRADLTAVGARRFRIHGIDRSAQPYLMGSVSFLPEVAGELDVDTVSVVRHRFEQHLQLLAQLGVVPTQDEDPPLDPDELTYAVAQHVGLPLADRQLVLAGPTTQDRLDVARVVLRRECELLRILHAVPAPAMAFGRPQTPS